MVRQTDFGSIRNTPGHISDGLGTRTTNSTTEVCRQTASLRELSVSSSSLLIMVSSDMQQVCLISSNSRLFSPAENSNFLTSHTRTAQNVARPYSLRNVQLETWLGGMMKSLVPMMQSQVRFFVKYVSALFAQEFLDTSQHISYVNQTNFNMTKRMVV